METIIKVIFGMLFFGAWIIGFLASLSVSIFILTGMFSLIQILFGVPGDATVLHSIFEAVGLV